MDYPRSTMAKKMYYYTSRDDYWCIYNLGLIWTHDGSYGEGIYLTEMPPQCGRAEVLKLLHDGQQDKYSNTEVCLETSLEEIIATKITTKSGHCIWVASSQLRLSHFDFGFFWSGNSAWNKISLKSQVKPEHCNLIVTKSPMTQLKELLDRKGLMTHYEVTQRDDVFECIASYRDKTAKAEGRSKKGSKNEAAKCLIRQILLGKPKVDSQIWGKCINEDSEYKYSSNSSIVGLTLNPIATHGSYSYCENSDRNSGNTLNGDIVVNNAAKEVQKSLSANIRVNSIKNLTQQFPGHNVALSSVGLSASKQLSLENMAEILDCRSGSASEDMFGSRHTHKTHHCDAVETSLIKDNVLNENMYGKSVVSEFSANPTNLLVFKKDKSTKNLSQRFQEIHAAQSSLVPTHTHNSENTTGVLNSRFRQQDVYSIGSGSSPNPPKDTAGYNGTTFDEGNMISYIAEGNSHVQSSNKTSVIRSSFGEEKSTMSKSFQEIKALQHASIPTHNYSSENVSEIHNSRLRPLYVHNIGSDIPTTPSNSAGFNGIITTEDNMKNEKAQGTSHNMLQLYSNKTSVTPTVFGEDESTKKFSKSFQEIYATQHLSLPIHNNSSGNMAEIHNSRFSLQEVNNVEFRINPTRSSDSAKYNGTTSCEGSVVNKMPEKTLHMSQNLTNKMSIIRPFFEDEHTKHSMPKFQEIQAVHSSAISNCSSKDVVEIMNSRRLQDKYNHGSRNCPTIPNNSAGNNETSSSKDNIVNEMLGGTSYEPTSSSNSLLEKKDNINKLTERFQEIRAGRSLCSPTHKFRTNSIADIFNSSFGSEVVDMERSESCHHTRENRIVCCGTKRLHVSELLPNQISVIRSSSIEKNKDVGNLTDRFQETSVAKSSTLPAYKQLGLEYTANSPRSNFSRDIEDNAMSSNGYFDHQDPMGCNEIKHIVHKPTSENLDKQKLFLNQGGREICASILGENKSIKNLSERFHDTRVVPCLQVSSFKCSSKHMTEFLNPNIGTHEENGLRSENGLVKSSLTFGPPLNEKPTQKIVNPMTSPNSEYCNKENNFQEVNKDDYDIRHNPIGTLQSLCVKRYWQHPIYQEVAPEGAELGTFTIDCLLQGFIGRGTGYNKKQAKQQAALEVLKAVSNVKRM